MKAQQINASAFAVLTEADLHTNRPAEPLQLSLPELLESGVPRVEEARQVGASPSRIDPDVHPERLAAAPDRLECHALEATRLKP